jgi:anaerobic selenocysteine-containing dehydrogenase/Fe-S-cluster-containing dehydrogenase component
MDNHHHEEPQDNHSKSQDFEPPRHWIGPEELDASYWSDSKIREKRGQEFFEKPVEYIDQLDKLGEKGGIARRDFLTIMGASMAMASFACARRPVHKIIPYVVKPEEITLGVPNWYASTCGECSVGCGVLVKNREGRPIKLEGNPDHPMNGGYLCTEGQASVLNLYDPDRLKAPIMRTRGGAAKEVAWTEVDASIQAKLKQIALRSGSVRVLSGEINGESTRRLIREFLGAFKNSSHVEYEPLDLEEIQDAQEVSYGTSVVPNYRFDKADLILSLGADFIGTWLSPLEHSRDWSKNRKLAHAKGAQAKLSKLVCVESTMTLTGSNADERIPVRPGDELKIALALANEIIVKQKHSRFANDSSISSTLSNYTLEKVVEEIGIPDGLSRLRQIAQELWDNRAKGLVVAGGIQGKTKDAMALQVAVNLLNSALENEGVTVDGTLNNTTSHASFAAMSKLTADMKAGKVDALIVYRSNPAYTLPRTLLGLEDAIKKVPLVIVVSDREDETGLMADYVLPDHHYLENWGDANPRKSLYSLQQPTISPIHSSRAFQDNLLTWGKVGNLGVSGLSARSGDWHDYLMNNWKESFYKGSAGSFEQFWEGVLRAGVYDERSAHGNTSAKPSARSFRAASLSQIPKYSALDNNTITLSLYEKVSMHDGRSANNAWLQEMPDPISSVTWDNYLNVAPALADKLSFKENDVVEVTAGEVSAQLPVHIQPGMHPRVVSAAVGYGRRNVGKVGNQAGVDVFPFLQPQNNVLVFSGHAVTLRKTSKFYSLASTQWHTATEDRPIINDITLAEFRKNPAATSHTDPELRLETVPSLWPVHEYKGHRWGMAIDLNSCTGCGACIIACQAENNIPVVGRDQVRVSRQMHWIRIDRYYAGAPENPDVVFQPMLCQHCENAPCETVCPVLATVHDDEGLNLQIYNRCVGTRYCQNNCPYKVRRFNFFDHWKSYEGTMNMVWNPDVTVRTRGIMEKCTFCTQRIRDAKDKAKDAGEKLRDGDFQTACQQTCATDAIVFGDVNDPNSRVSRMKESPQAFRVLETLNAKPMISYMTKVRNKTNRKGE